MKKLIIIFIILLLISGCNSHETHTQTYTVNSGDTLWGIASKYCPKNMDKRDYIDALIKLNNIENGTIYPNSSIQIIIY